MSEIYTGLPTNVTTPLTRTVTGATNATPIVVTTSVAHLFATGDRVTIEGVTGNTAANGTWSITKLTSTTFSLTGSVGNGAYVSGGTAINNSLTPQLTAVSDGDVFNASSIRPMLDGLADREQYLIKLATKALIEGADANTTYYARGGHTAIRLDDGLTAPRIYTLSNIGAFAGAEIEIYGDQTNDTFDGQVTVKDHGGTTMIVLGPEHSAMWAVFKHNGTTWALARHGGANMHSVTFTANGNFTVPSDVSVVFVKGCGGGGGGGAGTNGPSGDTDDWAIGGGGGGAAIESTVAVPVTPGTVQAVVIGPGGGGGTPGPAGQGGDGGDSTFGGTLAVFTGAQGGNSFGVATVATSYGFCEGGRCVRSTPYALGRTAFVTSLSGTNVQIPQMAPACSGGFGISGTLTGDEANITLGGRNVSGGFAGGEGGASDGADSGSYRGGGRGGGGAAGPYGAGAAGGVGGAGNGAGGGSNGIQGTSAAANTGAGGGGGGAGGAGSTTGGTAGSGGAGGSGKITVFWVR